MTVEEIGEVCESVEVKTDVSFTGGTGIVLVLAQIESLALRQLITEYGG